MSLPPLCRISKLNVAESAESRNVTREFTREVAAVRVFN